ncbi:MAG: NUDIX domain-containing protein [Solirubrobacterales bacterium]
MAARSAGILLYRLGGVSPELLLVHPGGPLWASKDLGVWSIPKGEPDAGEELLDCALREMEEELGEAPHLLRENLIELGTVRQKSGKVVHGWAAEADFDPAALRSNSFALEWPPRSGTRRDFPEVDRAEWLDPRLARLKINPAQLAFIDRLLDLLDRQG